MAKSRYAWMTACFEACRAAIDSLERQRAAVEKAADLIVETFEKKHKVLSAGNGGSAAEAMHLAEEAVGRFRWNRPSLPAIALTADGTALTCIGNDFGFDHVFSRQVEGLGKSGDLLVVFSTSGNSENLRLAVVAARRKKMNVITIIGKKGGLLKGLGDVEILIEGTDSGRIQEAHQLLMHILLDAVEHRFADEEAAR